MMMMMIEQFASRKNKCASFLYNLMSNYLLSVGLLHYVLILQKISCCHLPEVTMHHSWMYWNPAIELWLLNLVIF